MSAVIGSFSAFDIGILVGMLGIYGFIAYLFFFKKAPTLADVLKATDFGKADECGSIFSQFAAAANSCGDQATAAFCKACASPTLSPGARAMCSDPSAVALCRAPNA